MHKQIGFTLIELMISIVLGLLLTAAAVQLFITGQTSFALQRGVGDVQDNANFGIDYISHSLRRINYGNILQPINDRTPLGGIVLSTDAAPTGTPAVKTPNNLWDGVSTNGVQLVGGGYVGAGLLSQSCDGTVCAGVSMASGLNSDQLTIQYRASEATNDCEGHAIAKDQYVVERYFLRSESNATGTTPSDLALVCDAGVHAGSGEMGATGDSLQFGGTGQVIVSRVDHFHVLLGVATSATSQRFMTIAAYRALTGTRPDINALRVSMLVRATDASKGSLVNSTNITMLDQTVTLANPTDGFVRRVFTFTVALRNAVGAQA